MDRNIRTISRAMSLLDILRDCCTVDRSSCNRSKLPLIFQEYFYEYFIGSQFVTNSSCPLNFQKCSYEYSTKMTARQLGN